MRWFVRVFVCVLVRICVLNDFLPIKPDLIATEMLLFPSKSRNKNDSDPINGKTTPI